MKEHMPTTSRVLVHGLKCHMALNGLHVLLVDIDLVHMNMASQGSSYLTPSACGKGSTRALT
jgi:hypothetical protein